MPRLQVIDPKTATGKPKEVFEGPLKGKYFNIFKGLANSPIGLDFYLAMTGALKRAGLYGQGTGGHRARARSGQRLRILSSGSHAGEIRAGLTEEETLGARRGELSDANLGTLVRFTKTLNAKNGFVSDEDLAAFKAAGYDDGHVVDVISLMR